MEDMCARRLAEARSAGARQWAQALFRELIGVLALLLSERWDARARERRRRRLDAT